MQALNDSGLGEALIGGGLMDELRQPVFSLGLKGVDPANADKVCALLHALRRHDQLHCLGGQYLRCPIFCSCELHCSGTPRLLCCCQAAGCGQWRS